MATPPARGLFLVLEGIDGAGTTTQVQALGARLVERGHPVWLTREPSDRPIGQYLRQIMAREVDHPATPEAMTLLFAADRLDHHAVEIQPALAAGRVVLCDRYVLSSLAYQGCLTGQREWVAEVNRAAPPADLTILLDLPVHVAAQRRQGRDLEQIYEVDQLQEQVAQEYRRLALEQGAWIVDGCRSPREISELLWTRIEQLLGG